MAKLYFRYGAMGSSKTANALMVGYNYYERGKTALLPQAHGKLPALGVGGAGPVFNDSGFRPMTAAGFFLH